MNDTTFPLGERIAPSSPESEHAVLGALLENNDVLDNVRAVLAEGDFYTSDNRMIWRAICMLIDKGKPADVISVAELLRDRNELEAVGGMRYMRTLGESVPSAVNVVAYAEIIRERATLRAILSASLKMGEAVFATAGRPARALLDEAQALLARVDERTQRGVGTFRHISAALTELVECMDTSKQIAGLPTGFEDLDRVVNPMLPGQLIVVGARPAVGKTSFALNVAMHVASKFPERAVGMFSMEMTAVELAARVLSGFTGMATGRFREHRLSTTDWDRVNLALGKISGANLHIDETGGLSIQELTARARLQAKRCGGFSLLVVDYVQLSRSEGKYDNRAVEIGAVTSGLKRLAKELDCPVIALSQLNREAAKERKLPTISELRDSGSIEADADTILLLHREYVVTQNEEKKHDALVIIGKQRNGEIGTVSMDYDARLTRFFNQGQAPARKTSAGGYSGSRQ